MKAQCGPAAVCRCFGFVELAGDGPDERDTGP